MRGRYLILSVGMGLTTLGSAGLSHADPSGPNALPIHVVSVRTDDSDDQAEALTAALKSEVRKLKGWSLGDGDFSLEVLSLALRCPNPPDAACEMRIADQIKATRFIWGGLKRAPGHRVAGTLHLWSRDQGQTKTDVSFADNITEASDDSLHKIVQEGLQALTGGPPKGSVKIAAGDVNGQVFVDGEPSGAIHDGQATIFVPVGSHKIEVRAPGYAATSGDVSVRPNASVGLTLNPMTEEAARKASTPPNWHKIGGYTSLVVGGGLLAAGVYSSLKVRSISNDTGMAAYRDSVPGDVCQNAANGVESTKREDAARSHDVDQMCSSARTYTPLQYVFYGLGAVLAGTGVYLLLTDKKGDEGTAASTGRIQVVPSGMPGRGHAGLDIRLTF